MIGIIGTFIFICVIVCGVVIVMCEMDYERFKIFPKHLSVKESDKYPDGKASYSVFTMNFKKWWQLFEIDPDSFEFVNSKGLSLATGKNTKQDYCITHPCYYDKEKGAFLFISFEGLEYFRYYRSNKRIADVYDARLEQGMSLAIVGDIRSKIDKIVEETNGDIQRTLDLQKEIILRIQGKQEEPKSF